MRVLIALAEQLPPQQNGGSQKVAVELLTGLSKLGEVAALVGRLQPRDQSGFVPLFRALSRGGLFSEERYSGLPLFRFLREARGFPQVIRSFSPDVVLLHAMSAMPLAHIVSDLGIPLVIYWHDIEFYKSRGSPAGVNALHIANSYFTASKVLAQYGISANVIPPLFTQADEFRLTSGTGRNVLFINPVPEKGLEKVLEIAAQAPELKFEFVISWRLTAESHRKLRSSLAARQNITLTSHQSDMLPVFERARMLIVPSTWQEAWGRVVSEAQASGVPVLANAIGGLPQAVGGGGILFPVEASVSSWLTAIRELATDDAAFRTLRQRGLDRASQPETNGDYNLCRLKRELEIAISGK